MSIFVSHINAEQTAPTIEEALKDPSDRMTQQVF